MNITIFSTGSRGDIQPFVALGVGLQGRGHRVRLASFADAERWVAGTGLEFYPLAADFERFLKSKAGIAMIASQKNLIAHMHAIYVFSKELARSEGYWESYEKACDQTELVIYSATAPQGFHLAERLGIRSVAAACQPLLTPTGSFASPLWPVDRPLGRAYNRMTHRIVEQFMWQPFRGIINDWRRTRLKLAPIPWLGPFPRMRESLVLYGFSPHLVPKPRDWSERVQVTGFWFLDQATDWQPPRELADFLEAGPKPVYVGFGSTHNLDPKALARLGVEAVKRSGQRGLLALDIEGDTAGMAGDGLLKIGNVPHDWLFPRIAAAVHHGGAGIKGASVRAGLPSVVVPFCSDQPFWARRLEAVGAAPPPIPRSGLSVERLRSAIRRVVEDTEMRQCAAALGEQIRREDGVQAAVDALHRFLGL